MAVDAPGTCSYCTLPAKMCVCELALRSWCQDKGASFVELTANHDRPVSGHESQRSCSYAPRGPASACCLSCRRSAPLSCTVIRAAPEIESWRTAMLLPSPLSAFCRSTTPPLARHLDEQLLDERATTANKGVLTRQKRTCRRYCSYCRRAGRRSW